MINSIKTMLLRDLSKLKEELHLYTHPADMWKPIPGIANNGGNLTLHLIGNLRAFIGQEIGNSGYERQREKEFSATNLSLDELDELIKLCVQEVSTALDQASPDILQKNFPKEFAGQQKTTEYVLIHLTAHLSYHLGQINYHRRIISNNTF